MILYESVLQLSIFLFFDRRIDHFLRRLNFRDFHLNLGLSVRFLCCFRSCLTDPAQTRVCAESGAAVSLHTGTCRDQLTEDYILLKADQGIDPAVDRGVGKDLSGLLEGCCGQEGTCGKRRLCDTENDLLAFSGLLVESCKSLVLILEIKDVDQASGMTITSMCLSQISTPCRR